MLRPWPEFYMRYSDFKAADHVLVTADRRNREEEATVRQIAKIKGSMVKDYDFDFDYTEIMHFYVPTLARIYLENLGDEEERQFLIELRQVADLWNWEGDLIGFANGKEKRADEAKAVARLTKANNLHHRECWTTRLEVPDEEVRDRSAARKE
ncbi:hypothetical protein BKA70DRAFT_1220748 [Coprinopsis sp. MPI-PUGE-AT-0042]|nr:hypothetical protein BKA70DRAFT_1220748 [Coprinopsis sp. MPI-PUGE-AT-0042]